MAPYPSGHLHSHLPHYHAPPRLHHFPISVMVRTLISMQIDTSSLADTNCTDLFFYDMNSFKDSFLSHEYSLAISCDLSSVFSTSVMTSSTYFTLQSYNLQNIYVFPETLSRLHLKTFFQLGFHICPLHICRVFPQLILCCVCFLSLF